MDPINPIAGNPEALNQSPQTPTPPVKIIKPKSGLILMIVVHLIAVCALGYLIYQNIQLKNQSPQPKTTVSQSPTPSADIKANWKTYVDDKDGFSFRYPEDWEILNLDGGNMLAPISYVVKVKQTVKENNDYQGSKDMIIYFNTMDGIGGVGTNEYWMTSKTTAQIGGKTVYRYDSVNIKDIPEAGYVKGNKTVSIFIPLKDRSFEFHLSNPDYLEMFDQILSTFKFTNNESVSDI